MQARFATALLLGFVLAAVAACGGGSIETADPGGSPLTYDGVSAGEIVQPGTYHIVGAPDELLDELYELEHELEQPAGGYAPGTEITVAGLGLRCTLDSPTNCSVTLHDDDSFTTTGTIAIVQAGDTFPTTAAERQIAAANERADEESERADAEEARADAAAQAAAEAEAALQEEEAARLAAEAERQRLANEAEEARQAANRAQAKYALDGLRVAARLTGVTDREGLAHVGTPVGVVPVTPRHGMTALVNPNPSWGFSSSQLSASSGYSVTTLSNAGFTHDDELVVYSNRGPAASILLTQEYRGATRFQDGDTAKSGTEVMGTITSSDALLIRSGSFPSTDGTDKTYTFNHDSDHTMDADDDGDDTTTTDDDGILTNDLDTARFSGTFQGASGQFECTGNAACTIGRRGDRYVVSSGTWVFKAKDTATVRIDDRSYAYFGWWQRKQRSNETYSYLPFFGIAPQATTGGGTDLQYSATSDETNFDLLTGSATYRGPAIGQYAIYQPLGGQSGTGAFTARAELAANFADNMLSGTVTNFSNDSSWSLTLNSTSMAGGNVESTDTGSVVDWTIAGNTSDVQGDWTAEFYSETDYVGQTPDGVVGTFTAAFDADIDNDGTSDEIIGAIVGAFGARK